MKTLFVVLISLLAFVCTGKALECYQCTSAKDFYCSDDTFDIGAVETSACFAYSDTKPLPRFATGKVDEAVCIRYYGTDVYGKRYSVRGCSEYGSSSCEYLNDAAKEEQSIIEFCEVCTTARCNDGKLSDNKLPEEIAPQPKNVLTKARDYLVNLFK